MKLCYIFFAAIIAISQAASIQDEDSQEWIAFKAKFNKSYDEQEDISRKKIFIESLKKVKEHNDNYDKGLVSYKLDLNRFADISREELSQSLLGYKPSAEKPSASANQFLTSLFVSPTNVTIPDFIDWRKLGAVTPVKDQKSCTSCWAFSATGALEGQTFIKTGKLVSLSEQNLIDCVGYNDCVIGGTTIYAFNYVKNNGGIDTEDAYPYEGAVNTCRYNSQYNAAKDIGYFTLTQGDELNLKLAVATIGPISVAIDASHTSIHLYKEGIYREPECSTTKLDHGVLLVGYGTDENGKDYWIVKNSWGAQWGEQGYFRMARNENMCGVTTAATYPIV